MKHLLDSHATYLRYDPSNALNSLQTLPDQCAQAWKETKQLSFPAIYKKCDRIIVCGMGGSDLGGYVLKGLVKTSIKVPYEVVHDYTLPAYTNSRTLVIAVSYSGNTEEILEATKDAKKKKARIVVITSGGKLGAFAKKNDFPAYIFDDSKTNLSRTPRMGIGLTLFGLLGIMKQLGFVKITEKEIAYSVKNMRAVEKLWNGTVAMTRNPAKKLADQLHTKMPMYIGSEHLCGNMRIFRNQTHETAKTFATHFDIPELNHHLLEGLDHPKEKRVLHCVMFPSSLYHTRTQKRYPITKAVLKKNGVGISVVELTGETKLTQTLETLQFSGYVTFYMAMLQKLDPAPNPYVDYFKEQLSK